MSDNWVVQNLENALETWNEKLSEIWTLITTTPQNFKGGGIWSVIVNINGAVQAIGLALLVLFFVVGMVKTCGSFSDVKKPEHALKLFIRFALAKGAITYGIPCMWDRLIQQCIKQIMEPICEAKFSENSYGFRPLRSVEHAIQRIYQLMQRINLHYVVEFDIKGFFDNVDHSKLIKQIWSMGI